MVAQKKYKSYKSRILIIILLFVISVLSFEYVIKMIETEKTHQEVALKERDFDVIWDFLNSCIAVGESDAQHLAEDIETAIKEEYGLDKLEADLNNNDREAFLDLLDKVVEDYDSSSLVENNRNSCIILEGFDNILVDRMVDISKVDLSEDHSKFSDYRDLSINPKLFDTAKRLIMNRTSTSPIMMEVHDYGEVENHILVDSCSYDNLKKVYMSEGVMGLHNYQFLVPAYITENGDIFGNPDLREGNAVNNHKFVVIVTFNLYDNLIKMRPDFEQSEYYDELEFGYDTILTAAYMSFCITCIVFFIVTLFYIKNYNDAIIEYLGEQVLEDREREEHNND